MAFVLSHSPLTPSAPLALRAAPGTRLLRASEIASFRSAEEVVAAARAQAEAIMAGAHEALESERQRGYLEGSERARAESALHMAGQHARTSQYLDGVEDALVMLVMQATSRIIQGYSERERVVHAVRNALAVVRNQNRITVRVHPHHVEHVGQQSAQLLAGYPGVNLLDVVADARLAGDSCVLESDIGVVEVSTRAQLDALLASLRKVMSTDLDTQAATDAPPR